MKLTSEEAKQVVALYYANWKSPSRTFRLFNTWATNNNSATRITKKNVIDVMKRFEQRAILQNDTRRKSSLSQSEDVLHGVVSSLYQHPGSSLRITAAEINLSYSTTQKLARQTLGLYPYRLILTHALTEYDKMVRVDACQRLLQVITVGQLIVYSDEANFRTDGSVNRWNCRLWDYERPPDFVTDASQSAKQTTVWAGISKDHLFGPYFFPATITSDSYRAIISEIFWNDLVQSIGNTNHVWFQQDGASPHTAKDTRALLQEYFGEKIISKDFAYEWPPRSPDLTPCDFFLWGMVKELVYMHGRVSTVSQLQNLIIAAFNTIRQHRMHQVRNAVQSVPRRLEMCILQHGSQLLDQ
jgi:inhibitor of nuclear factor kappa-B kinase subunit alpha